MSGHASDDSHPHSPLDTARVVHIARGQPSDEELAALTVVLAGLAGVRHAAVPPGPRSAWANPAHRLRAAAHHGPDAWRISAFPS